MKQEKFDWLDFIKKIAVIAVPVALQNLLSTTGSMIDTMMLASLGEKTVGSVGLCAQFSSLMFSGYWGFVGGGMMFFSQYWGAKDDDGINRSYGMTLSFMMLVAVIFATLAVGFPEFVMGVYTDKPAIQAIGVEYLRIVGFAYPLQILVMAMSALLRSTERVKLPLYGGIAAVGTNCLFNYLLIFGKFGFPEMKVRGAALATVLSALVNLLVILAFVVLKKHPYVLQVNRHFHWKKAEIGEYLKRCFPIICNEVMIGVGNMLINVVLGRQSEEAIAALAVFRMLEGLVIGFFSGFSNAATVLVGKKVGAGQHETAYRRAVRLVYLCSGIIGVVGALVCCFHRPLLSAMGLSGDSFAIAARMLLIYTVVSLLRMGNWTQNDTFRSGGDAAFGSVMEITFMYLMVLPCVYISNYVFHAPFLLVFALCYADEPVRYIIMQRRLYSGRWIKPVSGPGKEALPEFHRAHGIVLRKRKERSSARG